jgi:CheY-like chemotaxis protein
MKQFIDLLTALAPFAWPLSAIVIALLLRRFMTEMITRDSYTFKLPFAEISVGPRQEKISVAGAAQQAANVLPELMNRVAALEDMIEIEDYGSPNREVTTDDRAAPILWVDDFPSNNAFLIQSLAQDGVRVREELSTSAAMKALERERFSVLISDLGRKEDGREDPLAGLHLTEAVRSTGNQIPILIFAGQRGLAHKDALLQAGANEVTASAVDVLRFVSQHKTGG